MQLGRVSEMYCFTALGYRLHLKNTDLWQLVKNGVSPVIAFLPIRLNFQDSVCGPARWWALAFLLTLIFTCVPIKKKGRSGTIMNFWHLSGRGSGGQGTVTLAVPVVSPAWRLSARLISAFGIISLQRPAGCRYKSTSCHLGGKYRCTKSPPGTWLWQWGGRNSADSGSCPGWGCLYWCANQGLCQAGCFEMLNLLSSGCEVAISSVEEDLLTNFLWLSTMA